MIDDTITKTIIADRAALFLMDSEGKNLYAQVFTVSKEDKHLVTLDHLESKCFEDYLNQLGRKINVVCYNGSNVSYDKSSISNCMTMCFIYYSFHAGFPLIKVWLATQLELGSYRMLLMQRTAPISVLTSMN